MEDFVIELAGVPVRVLCSFEHNRRFLKDYVTDKTPLFTVEPGQADLERILAEHERMDEAEGLRKRWRTEMFLENGAIHALLAEGLTAFGVLLMHGSALCMDGEGIVFAASSGTGKSTHARLWREAYGERVWMVNDDKPLLRIEESGVTVWGTPWNGKHHLSRNAGVPLKAIVKLERDAQNHIEPMGKADAFPVLIQHCCTSRDPAVMARVLNLEKRLLNAVDFYRLGCNTSPEAAIVCREGIR